MAKYVVLNDGETFTSLEGCVILDVPEDDAIAMYDIDCGYVKEIMMDPEGFGATIISIEDLL